MQENLAQAKIKINKEEPKTHLKWRPERPNSAKISQLSETKWQYESIKQTKKGGDKERKVCIESEAKRFRESLKNPP